MPLTQNFDSVNISICTYFAGLICILISGQGGGVKKGDGH